ncbi:hypothetical protein Q9L58_010013 [Maublancomyces gigas]|uniref:Gag-like protein n=1 Tax=Discina gigas TaxID=1032678 RepID=A0ABR3G5F1_9PEZI
MAELRKDLNETNEKVKLLSLQLAAFKVAGPPPQPPPPSVPKARRPKNQPPSSPNQVFRCGRGHRTPPPQDGSTKRELIVELSSPIPRGITDYAIITIANTSLASTEVKFCLSRRTSKGNILLLTGPNIAASSAKASSPPFPPHLKPWAANTPPSTPTPAGPSSCSTDQTPGWLTSPSARAEKTMSTMVISFPITTSLENFGLRSMTLLNHVCRLGVCLSIVPSTQCTKCPALGHHTAKCAAPSPRCAVCASDHLTSAHPCKTCKVGPQCSNPPIKCANCPLHSGHCANDPACPSKVKAIIRPTRGNEVLMT